MVLYVVWEQGPNEVLYLHSIHDNLKTAEQANDTIKNFSWVETWPLESE